MVLIFSIFSLKSIGHFSLTCPLLYDKNQRLKPIYGTDFEYRLKPFKTKIDITIENEKK